MSDLSNLTVSEWNIPDDCSAHFATSV